jgi:hypothetical protein
MQSLQCVPASHTSQDQKQRQRRSVLMGGGFSTLFSYVFHTRNENATVMVA